jgi:pyruvate kinase
MSDEAIATSSDALRRPLLALLEAVEEEEARQRTAIDAALPRHRASATNLAHYIGLRKRDLHRLQLDLAAAGLSSLGRCEGHVRDTLLRLLAWVSGRRGDGEVADPAKTLDSAGSEALLHANTRALFGPHPSGRHVYIMVTAPDAAEADAAWADGVLEAGASLLRINAAHGSLDQWAAAAATFRQRASALGRPGRVFVDLPGPKLRTEIRQLEQAVLHWPRSKDRFGRTLAAASVPLVASHRGGTQLPIPAEWLPRLATGDVIALVDAGGRDRRLTVRSVAGESASADCDRSLYAIEGLPLVWRRGEQELGRGRVGALPRQPRDLRFEVGDAFLLNENGLCSDPGLPALAFAEPQLLQQIEPGDRVILDDGRIFAVAEASVPEGLLCRVRRLLKSPARLRTGKGIAFPDSALSLRQLGAQDEAALAFALEHADGVGVSFVATPSDVSLVGDRIRQAGRPDFGMILKIETRGAVTHLPAVLFSALAYAPVGIMIARGDLAVELSFERLAEMQEELLWFGEACHLPVIWATQVLDNVAQSGLPTRAEVTDAAMSMRAECVMLNKGPFIATATRMLADIIQKMEAHQYKKRSLYRRLSVAGGAG